jgi:hypothetical protein
MYGEEKLLVLALLLQLAWYKDVVDLSSEADKFEDLDG